jgi:coproporphyrinogen III oxidase-like Fe-S oxidoreductase
MYESDAGPTITQISMQIHTLLHEITATAPAVRGLDFDGFYFGGGTPTIFTESDFRDILQAVRHAFIFSGRGVSTCEMHPYSATADKMAIAVENGVDRISISIGVQSLTPAVLQSRLHYPVQLPKCALRIFRRGCAVRGSGLARSAR